MPVPVIATDVEVRRCRCRRLNALVEREGMHANHKREYRLYREVGLTVRRRRKRHGVMIEREQRALPNAPNDVWSIDFVMDTLAKVRRLKCLAIVDDFTKETVDIVVDHGISGLCVARALDRAARFRGYPKAVRTDQGPEFTSRALDQWAYASGVTMKLIQAGSRRRMRTSNHSMASSAMNALTSTGSRHSPTLALSSQHGARTTTSRGRTAH
jgi:putative transposase